jgi:WD40 repeat protein/class 3 adenylate cyclase
MLPASPDDEPTIERRKATILAADVVDYARLMGEDEIDTHARVKAHLNEVIEPTIVRQGGRIVRLIGDGILAEFAGARAALACAIEIQQGVNGRNEALQRSRRIAFRIGINAGDIIVDGDELYGNGVNLAARLEAIADPGGIFLSGAVHAEIGPTGAFRTAFLGDQMLPNIAESVPVYRVLFDGSRSSGESPGQAIALPAPSAASGPVPPCPYRGLYAFGESDAAFFFGRGDAVQELEQAVHRRSLVALLGASGSGKSSVVFAGLLPRLRAEGGWLIASFRPDETPLRPLLATLVALLPERLDGSARGSETDGLLLATGEGRPVLDDLIARIHRSSATSRLLVVADQFEQIYTLCQRPDERQRFLDAFLRLTRIDRVVVVLTLRADFLGQALESRTFADALQAADLKLGPMTEDELRAAIENPARKLSVRFEMGLVDRILSDVRGQPGGLPLLEFALTELWGRQRQGRLTHLAYEEIGGVALAIAGYAEDLYRTLSPAERDQVRGVLLQLVRPGEGTEDTRRIASRAEIRDEHWPAVTRLANARLVVTRHHEDRGEDTAEVVHEALIREWQRLRDWIETDREFLVWRQRLAEAQREWHGRGRDDGFLLREAPLVVAGAWLRGRGEELAEADRAFIRASEAQRARERAARERGRHRVLAGLAAAAAVLFLVAAGAGYFWYDARQQKAIADQERDRSETLRQSAERTESLFLADVADRQLQTGRIEPAIQLALEALPGNLEAPERPYVPEAEAALYRAVDAYLGAQVLGRLAGPVWDGAMNAAGDRLVTAADDGEVRLWQLPVHGQVAGFEVLGRHVGPVLDVQFVAEDRLVLSASADHTARLWAVDGTGSRILAGHRDAVIKAALDPRAHYVATASRDGTARLFDRQTGAPVVTLVGHTGSVVDVDFAPDGGRLVTASADGTARLWDVPSGRPLGGPLTGHQGPVWRAVFSPDGKFVVTASDDATARLWDGFTGAPVGEPMAGHQQGLLDAEFDPVPRDGRWLVVTGSQDGSARLWDPLKGRSLAVLKGHAGAVVSASFSADGRTVVTASRDGTVRLWNSDTGEPMTYPRQHPAAALWARLSPDGRHLVSGSEDGLVKLWEAQPGRQALVIHSPGGPIGHVGYSPDQRWIVTTAEEKTLPGAVRGGDYRPRLWDAASGAEVAVLQGHSGDVYDGAFSPDGRWLVSAGAAGEALVWDLAPLEKDAPPAAALTLSPSARLSGHQGLVLDAEFSPDGRQVVTAAADGTARLWTIKGGEDASAPRVLRHDRAVRRATFSPDGARLLTISDDATAKLWDAGTGAQIGKDLRHGAVVTYAAFGVTDWDPAHPLRIVTGARDGKVRIWDGATGELLRTLDAHKGFVTRTLFSPDGRRILSSSMDHTARIWDTLTGREIATLSGHAKGIYAAAFSPDGSRVVTASYWDGTVRLWDAASGAPLAVFFGHTGGIKDVAFRGDGGQVVSAAIDGTARVWDVLPEGGDLLRRAQQIVQTDHLSLSPARHRELLSQRTD